MASEMARARFLHGVTPRLIGVTAAIVTLTATVAGSLATYRHYNRLLEQAGRDLRLVCGALAPATVVPVVERVAARPDPLRRRTLDGLVEGLRSFQPDLNCFALVGADGNLLYRWGGSMPEIPPERRKAILAGTAGVTRHIVPDGILVMHPCRLAGGRILRVGVLLPGFPAFLLHQAARDAAWIALTLLLSTIACGALVAVLTRSLRSVTTFAAAIERGELLQRVDVRSSDEAGAIAEAFNSVLFKLRNSYVSTLGALAALLESRDRNTESHSQRGLKYALELGRAAGLSPQALNDLEYGALLHDIGKVGIADHILRKNGPLTEEEWSMMRQHPTIGYNVLKNLDFLQNALPVVLHHQERWDGKGYPNGLKGEQIPLLARIFTIADSFDAMTSDRPYRRGMSPEIAVQEMRRNGGFQFDPRLVEMFVVLWESGALGRLDGPPTGAEPATA